MNKRMIVFYICMGCDCCYGDRWIVLGEIQSNGDVKVIDYSCDLFFEVKIVLEWAKEYGELSIIELKDEDSIYYEDINRGFIIDSRFFLKRNK